jgi:hypothetical protein
MLIQGAWNGIKITGAASNGKITISNVWMSSFNRAIDLDNIFDTVRIINFHHWPFGLNNTNSPAFYDPANYGIVSGRCDDLKVSDSLLISGTQAYLYQSSNGLTEAEFTNVAFDSYNGIEMSAGTVTVASSYFEPNGTAYRAISQSGGALTISSSWFGICCGNSTNNTIDITGTANFSVSDSFFPISAIPITYIYQAGTGAVRVVGNTFTPNTGSPSFVPVIATAGGSVGPLIVADNILTNSDPSGYFVVTTTPAASSYALVHDNILNGWHVGMASGTNQHQHDNY